MAHFYFHIRDGDKLILDDEGRVFDLVEFAKFEALASVRDLMRDALLANKPVQGDAIILADESGNEIAVFSIPKPLS